ncbi:MAG: FAD-binding protein [Opitutae bacterium]|nr:FAD-binding protein [Opitutae bacterium]
MKPSPVSRRQFIKSATAASLVSYGSLSGQVLADPSQGVAGKNWAESFTYGAARFHQPETIDELRKLVRRSRRVKALGGRHSFSRIADTEADMIGTSQFNQLIELDTKNRTVSVGAGMKYGDLAERLHKAGFALHNLASLPHIQVGGSIATATHGSGDGNGNLATQVRGLEWVTAEGELTRLNRGDPNFEGAVVHLGALGLITHVTLDILPAFDVRQYVYIGLSPDQLQANFDAIFSSAYSVSVFTDWQQDPGLTTIWLKHKVSGKAFKAPTELFGAQRAARHVHPIVNYDAEVSTPQMGVVGPWFRRLPHFLMEFRPSTAAELQSEFFVARKHAVAVIGELHGLRRELAEVLQISEIRTVKGDDLWMSSAYGENQVAFHFTWIKDWLRVQAVLTLVEEKLAPLGARPHWGKLTTMGPEVLRARYPKLPEFRQLAAQLDPTGKFHNDYLEKYVFG